MSFAKKTVQHLDCAGRRVFVRVDFNVPTANGEVTDDTRIVAAIPTIRYLLQKGARVVLASHLGRPKGGPEPKYSMKPVKARLERLLRMDVAWADDCVGEAAEAASRALKDGEVLLLENLRFHPEEEKNVPAFAEALAKLGDCYVNDAFGTAHRAHASTEGVTKFLRPSVAGFLMQKELDYLGKALDQPKRPFVAVLGGSKISGKIDVITALLGKVDRLLIGGAMMFTFNKAKGLATGKSLVEDDRIEMAKAVLEQAAAEGVELVLPVDCIASTAPDGTAPGVAVKVDALAADQMGVDIGPESLKLFASKLADAGTVVWNGPMGIFEVEAFAAGTMGVAKALSVLKDKGAVTVVGGGDSVAAVQQSGMAEKFSHLSTGGGASLEFLEGKVLPGVDALENEGAA
ncbi:MAG: phosphoglycerate kinase [Candidatus Eisenbacteria bacterium]|uniref:Phosphoglycerate kinase n=1 Tax=Eiseniibacteriota bacterium TaxID=2212470 RepID=A0A933SJV2_UNCEI|nr:phosphoglycerate kinase [Candidatus Eisenbacteria bacterium]